MARYDISAAAFVTPNGHPVTVWLREGTNDHNTANASLNEDEYGLRGRSFTGHALDVGGYLGTVTLALLVDNPDLWVTVVEPVPDNVAMIERNLDANGVRDRATIVHGLAGADGVGLIRYAFQGGESELHHAFVGNAHWATGETPHTAVEVVSWSLSTLAPWPVSLLKIDCEGGEYAFLDDPAVERVERIVGEFHPNAPEGGPPKGHADIRALLERTHRVSFSGPVGGPGGFVAERL